MLDLAMNFERLVKDPKVQRKDFPMLPCGSRMHQWVLS